MKWKAKVLYALILKTLRDLVHRGMSTGPEWFRHMCWGVRKRTKNFGHYRERAWTPDDAA